MARTAKATKEPKGAAAVVSHAAPKKAAPVDDDPFAFASTETPASETASNPTVILAEEFHEEFSAMLDAKQTIQEATARYGLYETNLIPTVDELRLEECRKAKKVIANVTVQANIKRTDPDTGKTDFVVRRAPFTRNSAYCKMTADKCKAQLKKEFGDDYDQLFISDTEYTLKVEDMSPEEKTLMATWMKETFKEERAKQLLTRKEVVKPTESFHKMFTLDEGFRARVEVIQSANNQLCKPFKPYFGEKKS